MNEDIGVFPVRLTSAVCFEPCHWSQLVMGPLAVEGFLPFLFKLYVDWCRSVGRPVPIVSVTFDAELLRRLVNEASFVCVDSVNPFATVESLVQRLKRVRHQAW